MSIASSENNYKIAKALYQEISDDFYDVENNASDEDDSYLIDTTLDNVKRLNRHINRINIEELEDQYDEKVIDIIDDNVDTFKEASYFIERALMSMKLFDKVHPVLDQYISKVRWQEIADDEQSAIKKLGRFLTSEDNYESYRTIINNIVKGTMKRKAFNDFFNSISNRIAKPKVKKQKQRNPLPPEMWPEKERKEHEKQMEKMRKAGVPDEKAEFDQFEGFISFGKYKKLHS